MEGFGEVGVTFLTNLSEISFFFGGLQNMSPEDNENFDESELI